MRSTIQQSNMKNLIDCCVEGNLEKFRDAFSDRSLGSERISDEGNLRNYRWTPKFSNLFRLVDALCCKCMRPFPTVVAVTPGAIVILLSSCKQFAFYASLCDFLCNSTALFSWIRMIFSPVQYRIPRVSVVAYHIRQRYFLKYYLANVTNLLDFFQCTSFEPEVGDTFLMLASKGGHHELLEYLLSQGAEVNQCNKSAHPLNRGKRRQPRQGGAAAGECGLSTRWAALKCL